MNNSLLFRSVISVTISLLAASSLRSAEPAAMPGNPLPTSVQSGGGPCFQPDGGGCPTQAGSGCCPSDCCCGGLDCCTGCGLIGGAEVACLRPYFNNNSALIAYTATPASESITEFTGNYNASPRIWLGYMNCCGFGGRLRYWEYDESASQSGVQGQNLFYFAPGTTIGSLETDVAGDRLSVSERLHMYTLDAEVLQSMQICCWNVIFGGGIRDAAVHIDRENAFTAAGDTNPREVADFGNHFDGVGPTVFSELRRPLGCCGLAFVGSLRGSLLYGTKSLRVTDVSTAQTQTYDQTVDGCLGVAEMSLGLEWDRQISCNSRFFVQGLWENQIWTNMGNSTSITGDNLGLGGFTLGLGVFH